MATLLTKNAFFLTENPIILTEIAKSLTERPCTNRNTCQAERAGLIGAARSLSQPLLLKLPFAYDRAISTITTEKAILLTKNAFFLTENPEILTEITKSLTERPFTNRNTCQATRAGLIGTARSLSQPFLLGSLRMRCHFLLDIKKEVFRKSLFMTFETPLLTNFIQ